MVAVGETEVRRLDPEDLDERLLDKLDLVVEVVVREKGRVVMAPSV